MVTALHITTHAVIRFQERVANLPEAEARAALSTPVIQRAAQFGAPYVRLPQGQRAVLNGCDVVTVLPAGTWPASLDRRRVG